MVITSTSGNVDIDELEKLKKTLPVNKCIVADMTIDGEKIGMKICRTGEEEFEMEGTGMLPIKGTVKVVDYKKKSNWEKARDRYNEAKEK